ncbi:MAG: sel1 repeat family protein [Roseomonas sp.]|jgi:hypothetical protein|nr:sel1 repeat family protein [Roseomonas sp.]MCA3282575.1 sel1 repeat family protein [Roseomonas sp.]MCA3296668.1 sel1 repeat family protein [Roseomonas sp.]
MMLRVENDRRFSLGHARITLSGVQAPGDGGFRIVREGYAAANLGRRGWQVQEEKLNPVEIRQEGPDTILVIGPRLTRHLEPGPLVFLLPATGLEASLFWPDDIDVFDGDLPPETLMPREAEAAPKPPPVASVPPAPAPSPPPPPPPREDIAVPAGQEGTTRTPLFAGIGLMLLVAIGGAAWWFSASPPTPSPGPTPIATPTPPPTPPATAERPWLERSDGMNLRDLVQSASDAAAIHAAALRRQAAGRHDDALVLFEEAGERGHAPALTAVARLYDPIGFVAGRPFRAPDPRAAARYYRDAVQKGDVAAQAPRAALKTWLEEQARAGNGTAETALKEFWQ